EGEASWFEELRHQRSKLFAAAWAGPAWASDEGEAAHLAAVEAARERKLVWDRSRPDQELVPFDASSRLHWIFRWTGIEIEFVVDDNSQRDRITRALKRAGLIDVDWIALDRQSSQVDRTRWEYDDYFGEILEVTSPILKTPEEASRWIGLVTWIVRSCGGY